jgi:hypothetical protein
MEDNQHYKLTDKDIECILFPMNRCSRLKYNILPGSKNYFITPANEYIQNLPIDWEAFIKNHSIDVGDIYFECVNKFSSQMEGSLKEIEKNLFVMKFHNELTSRVEQLLDKQDTYIFSWVKNEIKELASLNEKKIKRRSYQVNGYDDEVKKEEAIEELDIQIKQLEKTIRDTFEKWQTESMVLIIKENDRRTKIKAKGGNKETTVVQKTITQEDFFEKARIGINDNGDVYIWFNNAQNITQKDIHVRDVYFDSLKNIIKQSDHTFQLPASNSPGYDKELAKWKKMGNSLVEFITDKFNATLQDWTDIFCKRETEKYYHLNIKVSDSNRLSLNEKNNKLNELEGIIKKLDREEALLEQDVERAETLLVEIIQSNTKTRDEAFSMISPITRYLEVKNEIRDITKSEYESPNSEDTKTP